MLLQHLISFLLTRQKRKTNKHTQLKLRERTKKSAMSSHHSGTGAEMTPPLDDVGDLEGATEESGNYVFGSEPVTSETQSAGENGPILPPPERMVAEEGFALREWRR